MQLFDEVLTDAHISDMHAYPAAAHISSSSP